MRKIRPGVRGFIGLGLWLLASWSCASLPTESSEHGPINWPERVDFEAIDGQLAFRLEPFAEGVRVEDGSDHVLLVLRLSEGTLTISSPRGKPLGVVLPIGKEGRRFRVLSPGDRAFVVELHIERDGDLEVIDVDDKIINEAKRRDYGFKILDANGERVSSVRLRENKILLRNPSGTTFLSTRDQLSAESAAAIAFESLRFEHATALSVAIAHWERSVE